MGTHSTTGTERGQHHRLLHKYSSSEAVFNKPTIRYQDPAVSGRSFTARAGGSQLCQTRPVLGVLGNTHTATSGTGEVPGMARSGDGGISMCMSSGHAAGIGISEALYQKCTGLVLSPCPRPPWPGTAADSHSRTAATSLQGRAAWSTGTPGPSADFF